MNEKEYTWNTSGPLNDSGVKKVHSRKLMNETTGSKALKKKLRFGKADTSVSVIEKQKTEVLKAQGRKKIYSDVIVIRRMMQNTSDSSDDNAGSEVVKQGASALESGLYYSKVQNTDKEFSDSGYGNKMHQRTNAEDGRRMGATMDEGEALSNRSSREIQRSRMKSDMQKQAYTGKTGKGSGFLRDISKRLSGSSEDVMIKLGEAGRKFIAEHPMMIVMFCVNLFLGTVVSGIFSSCSMVMGGCNEAAIATSYTATEASILAVEADYSDLEESIQNGIDNVEQDYPGYDEYKYTVAGISHDPHELAALLTVLYEDYTENEVQDMLLTISDYQYTVDVQESVEIRTRNETKWHWVTHYREEERTGYRWDGGMIVTYEYTVIVPYDEYEPYEETVEYEYSVLEVSLVNDGISAAVEGLDLTDEQLMRYELLVQTKGNKPDLFED